MNIGVNNVKTYLRDIRVVRHLSIVKKSIYEDIANLNAEIAVTHEPVEYSDRHSLKYKNITSGERWGEFFDCAWFHLTGRVDSDIREHLNEYALILDLGGEGCVYNDDGVVQGITNVLGLADEFQTVKGKKIVEMSLIEVRKDNTIEVWVESGNNGINHSDSGGVKFNGAKIVRVNRELFGYYYDFLALYIACPLIGNADDRKRVKTALRQAMSLMNGYTDEEARSARKILYPYLHDNTKKDFTVYGIGHAHLDLGWLWPIRETKRKAERTFSNALVNIGKYDGYIFGASQPQQFEWIKDRRPSLYAKIKEAVKEGRIEPQGGMWCEPDTNITGAESLIRQVYYGKRFFKDEFGIDMRMLWLPDVFGYTGALPQIMKKTGMDRFMTIKLSWNNINKFPYHSFRWRGIDDSEVLVHMPPEGDYNSMANPIALNTIEKSYRERKVSDIALMPFGIGDGGAGPGEYHINMASRCNGIKGIPALKVAPAREFFDELENGKDKLPQYKGELYLEKHQGTYTTQAKNKRYNRYIERALHDTEWLTTLAHIKGMEYPHAEFDRIWKEVLLYQFHDILPGSSINRIYKESRARYEILLKELDDIKARAREYLKADCGVKIINYSPMKRDGNVVYNGKVYKYSLGGYSCADIIEADKDDTLKVTADTMENEYIKVVFNNRGEIISYVDKRTGHESVKDKFNAMRVYTDMRMIPYDAWDIDFHYRSKPSRVMKLKDVKYYIKDNAVIREQIMTYNKSTLTQKIVLDSGSEYLKFDNKVDWHERHKMLRADFRPCDYGDKVKCDIQFGHIDRSTKCDNSINKAQFEICAHKWVDVSNNGYGMALINDCKYGHRVKEGLISLNLLRSTVYPDPDADRGEHTFTYAIYTHKGEAVESNLIKYGYELNRSVEVTENTLCDNIISTDNEGIIIESIFVNSNDDIVIRMYESKGKEESCKVRILIPFKEIRESDMIFGGEHDVDTEKLSFTPFEIKTLLIRR